MIAKPTHVDPLTRLQTKSVAQTEATATREGAPGERAQ
jgi:hypothetical protein